MSTFRFGKDAVLYYTATALDGASNTASTVSWTEYDNVIDVNGNFTATKVSADTRATAKLGWEAEEAVLNKGEISFTLPQLVAADTTFDAIRDAWLNKTLVTMMALNDDEGTSGAQGLAGNFAVEMTQGQPLKDRQTWDVTLTVSSHPEWYEVP